MTRLNNTYCGNYIGRKETKKNNCIVKGKLFHFPKGEMGWYPHILGRIMHQLDAMLSHHPSVFLLRADLRGKLAEANNSVIAVFMRRFLKQLKQTYPGSKIAYIWAREQANANQPHYHLIIMVNAQKVSNANLILNMLTQCWQRLHFPKPHIPSHPYYIVKRSDWTSYEQALTRCTYLAKVYSKGNRPTQTKDFGASKLKPM